LPPGPAALEDETWAARERAGDREAIAEHVVDPFSDEPPSAG
jgi:hypothetical protein